MKSRKPLAWLWITEAPSTWPVSRKRVPAYSPWSQRSLLGLMYRPSRSVSSIVISMPTVEIGFVAGGQCGNKAVSEYGRGLQATAGVFRVICQEVFVARLATDL